MWGAARRSSRHRRCLLIALVDLIMKKAGADQYRSHAEAADRAAQAARDSEAKRFYIEIARRWRETAEEADRQWWWTVERRE
jgi:hypothetical protein